jgi:hypothetical protein
MISNVREDPPFAERRFRHRKTGEEVLLTVSNTHPPGGPFLAVIAATPIPKCAQGRAIAGPRSREERVRGPACPLPLDRRQERLDLGLGERQPEQVR